MGNFLICYMHKNTAFTTNLLHWYHKNKRDLPWRNTTQPYPIWLSEIILQQTRVAQGLPYYEKFLAAFPTIEDLAKASENTVLKNWQGLGYYSRARNLHATAKYIVNELNGEFPQNYSGLVQLKGVGDYTASAIASICYQESTAVVDGNVFRFLSRFFGIKTPINTSSAKKEFKKIAQELIDKKQPGNFNQAMMEFGARYCVPSTPNCRQCLFNHACWAWQNKAVEQLPVKQKKKTTRKRYFNYLVFLSNDDKTILRQREEKDIWQKLYEFPLVETTKKVNLSQLKKEDRFIEMVRGIQLLSISKYNIKPVIHVLSHQQIITTFWMIEIVDLPDDIGVKQEEIHAYPVSVLVEKFVNSVFKN